MHNRLTYYQNKYERKCTRRPTTKTGLCGLWGARVDAIDYYIEEIEQLTKQEAAERERVLNDPEALLPATFVSFKSRWGAAVCAQTQQSSNPTIWLTEWAPEPRDVYWNNLAIPYVELNIRRLLIAVAFFFLTFFFMIPIAFVQSLANIDWILKTFPFLKHLIRIVGRTTPLVKKGESLLFLQPIETDYLKDLEKHGVILSEFPLTKVLDSFPVHDAKYSGAKKFATIDMHPFFLFI